MKIMGLEVTIEHATDGQPDNSRSCAIAVAFKENYFPEGHIHVEVNSNGCVDIIDDNDDELFSLIPIDEDEQETIVSFIESYDTCDNVYEYEEWPFPYNFNYVRSDNA